MNLAKAMFSVFLIIRHSLGILSLPLFVIYFNVSLIYKYNENRYQ